jgi:hypothetical protein
MKSEGKWCNIVEVEEKQVLVYASKDDDDAYCIKVVFRPDDFSEEETEMDEWLITIGGSSKPMDNRTQDLKPEQLGTIIKDLLKEIKNSPE